MIDTIIAIVVWSMFLLGVISFINMIDTLLFDGAIGDFFIRVLDKAIEIGEWLIKKIAGRK